MKAKDALIMAKEINKLRDENYEFKYGRKQYRKIQRKVQRAARRGFTSVKIDWDILVPSDFNDLTQWCKMTLAADGFTFGIENIKKEFRIMEDSYYTYDKVLVVDWSDAK